MPTPKTIISVNNNDEVIPDGYITCTKCGKHKHKNNFYKTYDESIATGKLPYCKDCIKKSCLDKNGNIDLELVKKTLRELNRPYLDDIFKISLEEASIDPIGKYFKNLAMPQHRELTWDDSYFGNQKTTETKIRNEYKNDDILEPAKELFGSGYEPDEYYDMWNKYNFIKNNYPATTNLHTEHLRKYVIYAVKEEHAIAANQIKDAKEWGALRQKASQDAKLNITQLSKADLQGGLNSFSELSRAVEEAIDIIRILPEFKFRPNDAVDFNIWCFVNYIRRTEGKPEATYEEVYGFYDKKKEEYIKQYGDPYGIFKDDPTEENRANVEKFIRLPSEYEELEE